MSISDEQARAWLIRADDAGRLARALLEARAEVERLHSALTRLLDANATREHEGMSRDDWDAEILRAEVALEPKDDG